METAWPVTQPDTRQTAALIPNAQNARRHSAEQVKHLAALITEFGWTMPVLIDESDGIIAGHGRVMAAQSLGFAEVPVIVARGWSEAQKRAYLLADNRAAELSSWDADLLACELTALGDLGFDITLVGFAENEIRAMLPVPPPEVGLTDEDELPKPETAVVSRLGDLWICGRHRLLCGDSTNRAHVDRVMSGGGAALCFTSPPYGQQRNYKSGGIADWDALMQGVFSSLPMKSDAQVLVNLGMIHREGEWIPYWDGWIEWMRAAGWRRFGWYIWDQGPGLPGDWNGRLAPSHEFIFHFNRTAERARKTKKSKWAGHANHGSGLRAADGTVTGYTAAGKPVQDMKIPDSVIRVMRHKARGIEVAHPAVFPVDLVSEIHAAFSDPGDLVYEPFIGSGTQIISAQKNGRSCCGLELSPEYVDVAVRRWQLFTGQSASLEGDGRSFEQVAAARADASNGQ